MANLNKGIGVIGSATIDQIVGKGQSFLKMGGVTTYAGLTYRRHGIPTLIVSNLAGRDWNIIKKFEVAKIEVFSEAADQTTHFVNYIRGHQSPDLPTDSRLARRNPQNEGGTPKKPALFPW